MANFSTQCCNCVFSTALDPSVKCPHDYKRMYLLNVIVCDDRVLEEYADGEEVYRPILACKQEIDEALKANRENYSEKELSTLTAVLNNMNKHPERYSGGILIDGSSAA